MKYAQYMTPYLNDLRLTFVTFMVVIET